jgi:putative glutamine amidotransferase
VTSDSWKMSWLIWKDVQVTYTTTDYLSKVIDAGGAPIILPAVPELVEDVLRRADALLITGGADIEPSRYGAERHPRTLPPDAKRDQADLVALAVAERLGLPVLAICRGLQIMVVARGGTLHQHLPEHTPPVPGQHVPREIQIEPDSRLGVALGPSVTVHCHHHQAVDELGAGLVATAWAEDGVIEGIEDPAAPFLVGIQAHAEVGRDTGPLFTALVQAARRRMSPRSAEQRAASVDGWAGDPARVG